jgi:hypothetical protein
MANPPRSKPFFPRDRPRFWVVGVTVWLCGFLAGLLGFGAATLELIWLQIPLMVIFVVCWLVGAICRVGYVHGIFSRRYRNIVEKPWSEQVW